MIEDFNNNEKKENINFKSLGLKIFLFLGLVVICYNLFFCSSNDISKFN
ncbi:MAG: hypothetical protein CM15mP101_09590 [Flavobacteriaceae bacterium]|nr:MAG: hypothetical protein CM15mP101_09590 [Flavobacteriaceae bacterium]